MAKPSAKSFRATLERIDSPLKWVIIRIPFDVHKLWGARGQLKVKGEINGFAFRTSLFPRGKGDHILLVNKRMQQGARAVAGTIAQFHLEPDTEERVVTLPAELKASLAEHRPLRRWFDQLNYSTRKEIADWIGQHAKKRPRAEIIAWNNHERDLRLSDLPLEIQEYMEDYIPKCLPRNRVVYHWFDVYDIEEERL